METDDVVALAVLSLVDADFLAFGNKTFMRRGWDPAGGPGQFFLDIAGLADAFVVERFGLVLDFGGRPKHILQPRGVEIDVGYGREESFDHEHIDITIMSAEFPRPMSVHGNTLSRMDQQVLKRRGLRVFPAHPELGATCSLGRLFTLVAKHTHNFFLSRFYC